MSARAPTLQEYLEEASNILKAASKSGVTLKAMGAIAFLKHCPHYVSLSEKMNRALTDIDLAGYSRQRDEIVKLFRSLGYTYDIATYIETAFVGRLIFQKLNPMLHVDVFLDRLQMCHTIEFKGRIELDEETIPLAEMFLEKLQIVKMAEKDVKDVIILLLDHELGSSDEDVINIDYISKILSKDWGFYYTVSKNLQKILNYVNSYEMIKDDEKEVVKRRIQAAIKRIEDAPKSMGWKLRAKVGTKVKWYQEVEEAERRSV